MKVGVMIVGARGATASTLIATAMSPGPKDAARFLISEQMRERLGLSLIAPEEIAWGGWDVMQEDWAGTLSRHGVLDPEPERVARFERVTMYEPVVFEVDHAAVVERVRPRASAANAC
jgi:hypothetical protein